ncbi:MAG: Glutamate-tRNA ligase [candidate division CPR1 bacterium GW2011_GWA2_42_17]|uniref:Glutamate--tRNA ligase n=1 Tax=candidate division CPR1 bacterium GW2011_GWA2_42_17 TaxID=1618341 RepID=A0A0G1B4G2_9BACT|nr:MAG: Glutamate-tRNA ligase [candidate division CPR1 bacterium GW2011_GWA2_42_17]
MNVRVRIAPSPTGFAHVGTAYMALFNWAFAKKNHGAFVLRLEDTDQKRHVPEAEEAIYSALKWLNINPDESPVKCGQFGPYRQSERLSRYRETSASLVKSGTAYPKDGAIWLKMIPDIVFEWEDAVRGKISFDSNQLKDWVILKSDLNPTYNFANVIDDLDMKISHVIRGEEHISNTPLQLSVYQALGKKPPVFAHLPVLRAADHKKLSKRRDPVSLQWFREEGYLPEALLNFLALQGWSHPEEKDIFTADEFAKLISLERIKTSAPVFDSKKLDWLNGQYIKTKSDQELAKLIGKDFAKEIPKELVEKFIPLVKERLRKLKDFSESVNFFITAPNVPLPLLTGQTKHTPSEVKQIFLRTIKVYEENKIWRTAELEIVGHHLLETTGWTPRELFMTIRVALSGKTATPPLFEMMAVLGKDETLKRLMAAAKL